MYRHLFSSNNQKFTKHLWIWFLAIFFANVCLKIIYLNFSSFWYDEIISIQTASLDFGHIKHASEWDNNPPFYYYCLSVWIKLFNDSEFIARLLSVIFSSCSAAVLFILANRYFNKVTALISSMLFFSSNILFYYSHECRAYSLVVLLALISTLLYFNLRKDPRIKTVLLLGLVNFLLVYTHYIAGLVVFFQVLLALFYFDAKQKKQFSFSILIVILLIFLRFTQKQFLLIIGFNTPKSSFWLQKLDAGYLKEVFSSFLFNDYFAVISLCIIVTIAILLVTRKLKYDAFHVIYSLFLSLGAILLLFGLGKLTPIFLDRYLIFTIPFLFILTGYGLSFITFKPILLLLSGIFLVFCLFKIDFKTDKKMDYRNAVACIKSLEQKTDLIIVKTQDIKPLFCYYYYPGYFKNDEVMTNDRIIFCSKWSDVSKNPKDYKRVIVIDSFEHLNPNEPEFVLKLSELKTRYYSVNLYKGVKITFYN